MLLDAAVGSDDVRDVATVVPNQEMGVAGTVKIAVGEVVALEGVGARIKASARIKNVAVAGVAAHPCYGNGAAGNAGTHHPGGEHRVAGLHQASQSVVDVVLSMAVGERY